MQHPNPDRRLGIPETDGGEAPLVIEDDRQGSAGCTCGVRRDDRVGVDPRMSAPHLAEGIGRQPYGDTPFGNRGKVQLQQDPAALRSSAPVMTTLSN